MRIAFVFGCAEPGKDGVGDYARCLAASCASLGHECLLVAINDRHCDESTEQFQQAHGVELRCVRLSPTDSWSRRAAIARRALDEHRTEVVSLQFVPYALHPRGLVGSLSAVLKSVVTDRSVQVMLHEIWIGSERAAPWRRRLVGLPQRRGIKALLRRLSPAIVHTSNDAYAALLDRHGVPARVLPLFGNIEIEPAPAGDWLAKQLTEAGVAPSLATDRDRTWRLGIFGTLHPQWQPESLMSYLQQAARRAARELVIVHAGRPGAGVSVWRDLQRSHGTRHTLVSLGERAPSDISCFLQGIDFGIALTPWQLAGKSGTVASMIEHGVPVIVPRDDVDYGFEGLSPGHSPLLYRMDPRLPDWMLAVRRSTPCRRLPEVTQRFLQDVQPDARGPHRACTAALMSAASR